MAVPPPPIHDRFAAEKTVLRRHLRAARNQFVAALNANALSASLSAMWARLEHLIDAGDAGSHRAAVAGYAAHGGEPDVLPFLIHASGRGHIIALPHVQDDGRMRFVPWAPDLKLVVGFAGIAEPQATAVAIEPAILLVPLIGFDRAGNRLGQGGGYYDRWFAAHPQAMRIGVAWSVQEVAAIPRESWDMPLHAIVTEKDCICP